MSGTQTEITRDANKRKYYSIKSRPRNSADNRNGRQGV